MRLLSLLLLGACGPDVSCEDGTVQQGDTCEPYQPGEPVPFSGFVPSVGAAWQWQITGSIDTSVDVPIYDVDLFDLMPEVEAALHADGRWLVCYLSAGSYEPWRPDASDLPDEAIGRTLDGWPDERWVDVMHPEVRAVMEARFDLAVSKGCDAIEPDNVTAWSNRSGFGTNATEQLSYNRFLADAAHERGLAVALKNDLEQIGELVDWFDFAVNESCERYNECDTLQPFLDAGKPVLHAEYVDRWARAPDKAVEVCGVLEGLSTIVKEWDLGPLRQDCEGL